MTDQLAVEKRVTQRFKKDHFIKYINFTNDVGGPTDDVGKDLALM